MIEVKCEIERVAELCTIASVRTLDDHACTVNILAFLQLTFNLSPLRLQTFHKENQLLSKGSKVSIGLGPFWDGNGLKYGPLATRQDA